jgi:hypothetical protein
MPEYILEILINNWFSLKSDSVEYNKK